ncbi:MAG: hypothetical protein ACT4PP_13290 [Sporichthyaceae bacterium]
MITRIAAELGALRNELPNPAPKAPPGTEVLAGEWIGYFKYVALIAGVFGLIACGVMMMLGRRHRSALASDGAAGIPWVLGGLAVVSLAAALVTSVLPAS